LTERRNEFFRYVEACYLEDNLQNKQIIKQFEHLNYDHPHITNYILATDVVRGCSIKSPKTFNPRPIEKYILDNSIKTNVDYKEILDLYKNDENAFLFLDPPYLFSDNSGYLQQNEETDMTHIVVYLKEYSETCKCKVMLIINKLK